MKLRHFVPLLLLALPSWSLLHSQAIPRSLQGNWRVTSVLPTQTGCWAGDKASNLLNTSITYSGGQIRWNGSSWPITETLSRSLSASDFRDEYSKTGQVMELASLGIRAPRVTELDLQHDDVDITDVTTEIPGDTVFLAGPNRIIVSVCGTYFEATRSTGERTLTSEQRNTQRTIQQSTRQPVQRTAQRTATQTPTRKSGL